jgi:hypothetical protein
MFNVVHFINYWFEIISTIQYNKKHTNKKPGRWYAVEVCDATMLNRIAIAWNKKTIFAA